MIINGSDMSFSKFRDLYLQPKEPRRCFLDVTIMPNDCRDILEFNINNRNPRQGEVDSICRDILSSRYLNDGNSIKFDKDGYLCDGQHRLLAAVKANKPIVSDIATCIQSSSTIDSGTSRTLYDCMAFDGYSFNRYQTSVLRYLKRYNNGEHRNTKDTKNELEEIFEKYRKSYTDIFQNVALHGKVSSLTIPSYVAAYFILAYEFGIYSIPELQAFSNAYRTNEYYPEYSTKIIVSYRDRLAHMNNHQTHGSEDNNKFMQDLIYSFFRNSQRLIKCKNYIC